MRMMKIQTVEYNNRKIKLEKIKSNKEIKWLKRSILKSDWKLTYHKAQLY